MKFPLTDYGTPEEEAWRWKFVPWYIRYQRLHDTYPFTVKYYDKPEGQDLLGKVIAINRIVLPYASAAGVAAAFMHTKVTGFQATAGRIFYFVWPISGAATAFATTSYFGAKLRGKDDAFNYGIGAIAAGSVLGKWQRCHVTGWTASLFLGIIAMVQRIKIEEGFTWWAYEEQIPGDHRWHKFKWDIYKDPLPKGYTTSTEESKA